MRSSGSLARKKYLGARRQVVIPGGGGLNITLLENHNLIRNKIMFWIRKTKQYILQESNIKGGIKEKKTYFIHILWIRKGGSLKFIKTGPFKGILAF